MNTLFASSSTTLTAGVFEPPELSVLPQVDIVYTVLGCAGIVSDCGYPDTALVVPEMLTFIDFEPLWATLSNIGVLPF